MLSGVQPLHWAFKGLWLCRVHEEGLCRQGQVRAPGKTAWFPYAVCPLDWGGLAHIPAAPLKVSVCGLPASEPADSPRSPQCTGWHPFASLLPGKSLLMWLWLNSAMQGHIDKTEIFSRSKVYCCHLWVYLFLWICYRWQESFRKT